MDKKIRRATIISKSEEKAESEPSGLGCSNLFTHIKGKPHPAQRRTASPAPGGSCKAIRTPQTDTVITSPAERDPTHLCNTTRKEEGNCKQICIPSSPEERVGAKQNAKEVCCLPTEIQFFGTFHCRPDPLLPCEQGEVAAASLLSTHTPAPMGMETGSLPRARVQRLFPCRSVSGGVQHHVGSLHSFTPHFSKLRLSLRL